MFSIVQIPIEIVIATIFYSVYAIDSNEKCSIGYQIQMKSVGVQGNSMECCTVFVRSWAKFFIIISLASHRMAMIFLNIFASIIFNVFTDRNYGNWISLRMSLLSVQSVSLFIQFVCIYVNEMMPRFQVSGIQWKWYRLVHERMLNIDIETIKAKSL